MRTMKPWQKIAVTIVSILALFSVMVVITIFNFLPAPEAIGGFFRRIPKANNVATSAERSTATTAPVAAMQSLTTAPTLSAPALTPEELADANSAARKKLVSEKFIDRYMSDDRIQSRVCDNLASSVQPFKNVEEFGSQLEKSLLGETPPSATAEAVMLPLEYTLKNDAVRELVDQAKNAADRGATDIVQKAQFYAQALRATASVLSSQDELEAISADAYQLYTLSRAAAFRPEILQDPEMGDFCRGIERAAVDGVNRDEAFDRERMARLLTKHGISNEAIGYDPRMSTRLSIITNDNGGMQIKMPWLDAVFQTSSKATR